MCPLSSCMVQHQVSVGWKDLRKANGSHGFDQWANAGRIAIKEAELKSLYLSFHLAQLSKKSLLIEWKMLELFDVSSW